MFIKAKKLADFLHSYEMKKVNEFFRDSFIVRKVFYKCSFYWLFRLFCPTIGIDGPEDLQTYFKLFINKTSIFD